MRFLCISDVHGNAKALEAVLEEVRTRDINQVIVCGDLLFPGPEPLQTWHTLIRHHALCVQGVGDRALATLDPDKLTAMSETERGRLERLKAVHTELGELIIARLGKLPPMARLHVESGAELVVVHGSPKDPTEPFTPDMSDEEMNALIADDPGDIIVCGGSHVPFERSLEGVHIINVGSVGEAPEGGVAHATIIESTAFGTSVHQLGIPLDDGAS